MFKKYGRDKMDLQIAGKTVCRIEINKNNIKETYRRFMKALNKVEEWERPALTLLFKTPDGKAGITTIDEQVFIIDEKDGKSMPVLLDYSAYNLSSNADQEEILFVLAEEFAADLKENVKEFTNVIVKDSKELTKEYVSAKILRMAEDIETAEKRAKRKYNVPEFMKNHYIEKEKECIRILKEKTDKRENG